MAGWFCVSIINNDNNRYQFATVPDSWYRAGSGNTSGSFIIAPYRQSSSATGSDDFMQAQLELHSIEALECTKRGWWYNYSNFTNVNDIIYGKTAGTCVNIALTFSNPGTGGNYNEITEKYLSPVSHERLWSTAGGLGPQAQAPLQSERLHAYVLFANLEEEKIYLGVLDAAFIWQYEIGRPAYYDRISIGITFFNAPNVPKFNLWDIFKDSIPQPSDNPYEPGGTSDEDGGGGDFDDTSDPIPIPPDPTISAASSGLVTIYNPTLTQMRDVADALLNPGILTALANAVVKLSDVIIGLSIFPLTIPDGGRDYIKVNLLGFQWNTGVECTKAGSQFIPVDCGTLDVNEYWGSCLDYSPFTQIGIFLPYCGYFPLNVDEVMGHTLGVVYKVDLFSGQCIAFITVDGSVHYQFTGSCSTQIPISSQSYDGLMSALLEFAGATAEFAGAGATAAEHREFLSDNSLGLQVNHERQEAEAEQKKLNSKVKQNAGNLASAALGVVMGCKPNYAKTGMIHGPAGFMGVQKPYINIIRPRQSLAEDYQTFEGFPSNITETLGNLEGYTKVESIKLAIPEATALEKEAIITLLQGGVYL